ncbi:MAG: helix-turn-helix domain-containing protein, partial [Sulfobacillus thermotolerans]|nr:helix-turn-helix domain-containing protein [Sulfobacillus thermotolerans]
MVSDFGISRLLGEMLFSRWQSEKWPMVQKEMSQLSRWFDTIPESVQAEFVQEKLGALLQSSAYSQELLWTLQVYLESNGHARAASKRLYIHRNTLS